MVGAWSRIEGTPQEPNPNYPDSHIANESLFHPDGHLIPSITVLGKCTNFFMHVFRIHYFESICPRKPRKLDFSVTSGILNKIKSINVLEAFFCDISSVLFKASYQNHQNLYHSAI